MVPALGKTDEFVIRVNGRVLRPENLQEEKRDYDA
jgi:hypothetical protein